MLVVFLTNWIYPLNQDSIPLPWFMFKAEVGSTCGASSFLTPCRFWGHYQTKTWCYFAREVSSVEA